jgi:(2Fe-2S) ferredoxin
VGDFVAPRRRRAPPVPEGQLGLPFGEAADARGHVGGAGVAQSVNGTHRAEVPENAGVAIAHAEAHAETPTKTPARPPAKSPMVAPRPRAEAPAAQVVAARVPAVQEPAAPVPALPGLPAPPAPPAARPVVPAGEAPSPKPQRGRRPAVLTRGAPPNHCDNLLCTERSVMAVEVAGGDRRWYCEVDGRAMQSVMDDVHEAERLAEARRARGGPEPAPPPAAAPAQRTRRGKS